MIGAIDTETTGLDLWHGCKPFFLSACTTEGDLQWWEWDVDPTTREPIIPKRDIKRITRYLESHKRILFHNAKFDMRAMEVVGIPLPDWSLVDDTLIASHVMASGESHKLKDLALLLLDVDDDDEQELQDATNKARRIGRKKKWRIAEPQDAHFPALKRFGKKNPAWRLDTWLPRAVAKEDNYPKDHPWWTVLRTYGVRDAERTASLWEVLWEAIQEDDLEEVYEARRKLLGITYRMESAGVPACLPRIDKKAREYQKEADRCEKACYRLARHKIDNINSSKQLQGLLYGSFGLDPVKATKTGWSTDADTLLELLLDTPDTSKAHQFITNLMTVRKRSTALSYLDGYKLSGIALSGSTKWYQNWINLHPHFNITGTATTRFSSHDPNAQNISKQEISNLREVFGPLPGREWYAMDYSNIEKRIPAYLCEEQELIELFESGGSYHLLIAEMLCPEMFKKLGPKAFKQTEQYRWIKNGNFAEQYGGQQRKVDATFRIKGAFKKIKGRFPKIAKYGQQILKDAYRNGFVTTLGGYRLQCPREPTKPFNYFIQGSAGWVLILAMIRIDEYLQTLGDDYWMILTVHDELVFDFPKKRTNIQKIKRIKSLMEQSGDDIGLPTPVEVDRIRKTWADGVSILAA